MEYIENVQNNVAYRKPTYYELNNSIVHPTHFDQITPERVARDPNGVIASWYNGKDVSDQKLMRSLNFSKNRRQVKMNKRKVRRQAFDYMDNGELNWLVNGNTWEYQ